MPTRRRIDPDVAQAITASLLVGYKPAAARARADADPAFRGRVPSLRTIAAMAAELRPRDAGDVWTVGESDPAEAALVLPVLAELIAVGNMTSVTRQTGRWIAVLRRIVPDMPTLDVLVFAARYQAAAASGDSTYLIDLDLARKVSR
ncbi:MAG TPA: hypothetical protein VEW95_05340 [Candidatus Limnocylindrales bacterium]|nr:hypothetical protein [Candidatus Limnocylindrales bacterium]